MSATRAAAASPSCSTACTFASCSRACPRTASSSSCNCSSRSSIAPSSDRRCSARAHRESRRALVRTGPEPQAPAYLPAANNGRGDGGPVQRAPSTARAAVPFSASRRCSCCDSASSFARIRHRIEMSRSCRVYLRARHSRVGAAAAGRYHSERACRGGARTRAAGPVRPPHRRLPRTRRLPQKTGPQPGTCSHGRSARRRRGRVRGRDGRGCGAGARVPAEEKAWARRIPGGPARRDTLPRTCPPAAAAEGPAAPGPGGRSFLAA